MIGSAHVCSGQLPCIDMSVEMRKGNKVRMIISICSPFPPFFAVTPLLFFSLPFSSTLYPLPILISSSHLSFPLLSSLLLFSHVFLLHQQVVTHIRGLEVFGIDLNSLTKELQKKFASSATVTLIPGKLSCIRLNIHYLSKLKKSLSFFFCIFSMLFKVIYALVFMYVFKRECVYLFLNSFTFLFILLPLC